MANPPYRVRVTGGNPYTIRVRTAAQGPQGPQGAQGPQGLPGGNYTLPAATNSTLGGIIVGDNLTIINGRLSGTPGGVTTFNNRTGNVTLLANDVTSLANSVYLADTKAVPVSTTYGNDVFYGLRYKKNPSDPASFFAGQLSLGSTAVISSQLTGMAASVELDPDDIFGGVRLRWNNMSVRLASDGLSAETGTANYTWSASSFLTQGRADSRYATPANLNAYLPTANFTYANLTGKPAFATVATSGSYSDLSGTPNLSLYLTTANAAATYLPSANFSFANITGKPTTLAGYGITDGLTTTAAASTYATIASLSSYLTTASAASTYATIASLSSYLTTASAASTYLTQSAASSTYATLSTNTFTGQQNYNSNILDKPRLQSWRESYTSPTISSGTLTLDLSVANNFYTSLNAAITTISITNVPASTMEAFFKLEITSDGTARAITWPGSWTFLSGSNPSVPSTNGAKTVLIGYTKDGGTSWSIGSNK